MAQSSFRCSECQMIQNLRIVYQGVVVSLSVGRLSQEDGQIEASLSYTLRPSQRKKYRGRHKEKGETEILKSFIYFPFNFPATICHREFKLRNRSKERGELMFPGVFHWSSIFCGLQDWLSSPRGAPGQLSYDWQPS